MIDIHNHIIYGIDDGPQNIEESVEILKKASELGIEGIIATPHFRKGLFNYSNDLMMKNYNELVKRLDKESFHIDIYLGHEAYLDSNLLEEIKVGNCLTLAKSQYVLVELPSLDNFYYIKKMLFDLANLDFIPIIAHCERLVHHKLNYSQLLELKAMGCFLQVNATFLIKKFKNYSLRQWIMNQMSLGKISFVASDSHNLKNRRNNLLEAKKLLARRMPDERIDIIFNKNPKRIICNESIL
jgi:protein-tyrosine phosphatase